MIPVDVGTPTEGKETLVLANGAREELWREKGGFESPVPFWSVVGSPQELMSDMRGRATCTQEPSIMLRMSHMTPQLSGEKFICIVICSGLKPAMHSFNSLW